uniref:Uncharacterized protein n=1 Tax=Arion vulgaris TaxID=1028688 RepID=A0A0B7AUA6_9EUPU
MHGDSEVKNADEKQKDIGVSSETTKQKRGVLGRRKCEKVKHADQEKTSEKRLSIGPKIIPVTASKQSSSSSAAESLHSTLNPPVSNADDSCPTYEKFGDISQTIQSSTLNQKSLVAHKLSQNVGIYDTDIHAKNCSFENYSQTLGRVKDNAKHLTENSNGTQQLFLEEPEPPKKPPRCLNKSISADYSKWSKTLPCRSLKTSLQASGNKNSSHVHVGKDVLQTAGIVKNGIKKFEQTSS